jgi:hypothetical protein
MTRLLSVHRGLMALNRQMNSSFFREGRPAYRSSGVRFGIARWIEATKARVPPGRWAKDAKGTVRKKPKKGIIRKPGNQEEDRTGSPGFLASLLSVSLVPFASFAHRPGGTRAFVASIAGLFRIRGTEGQVWRLRVQSRRNSRGGWSNRWRPPSRHISEQKEPHPWSRRKRRS